jgi:hypothetical protein
MSEALAIGGEKPIEKHGDDRLKVLTEMSDKFDPQKAEQLEKEAKAEKLTGLSALEDETDVAEQEVSAEFSPEEASREYLDLLMDLSGNFTSPEAKTSRVAEYNRDGEITVVNSGYSGSEHRIVGQLLETATGKKFNEERRKFDGEKYDDEYMDRELALGMADDIIEAELEWREAGEGTTVDEQEAERAVLAQEHKDAKNKLAKIGRGPFGGIKTAFFKLFRGKEYRRLVSITAAPPQTEAEKFASSANRKLQKALEAAYSEDYGYGHHHLKHTPDGSYADRVNEEYNNAFFDDSRKEKIDRAVELRRKLREEGIIKR